MLSQTNLKPDTVWWDNEKMLQMVELTIHFETTMADAAEKKETKYEELVQSARQAGYITTLTTVEVGT